MTRSHPRMAQEPHSLVLIDETSFRVNMTRLRGRAPVGERLFGTAPFGRWQTQTPDQVRGRLLIAGLTCDDLIAPRVIKGAMDRIAFDTCIETPLAPLLEPGTVVILDTGRRRGTPRPYSPDPGESGQPDRK